MKKVSDVKIRLANIDDLEDIVRLETCSEHEVYSKAIISDSLKNKNYYNIVAIKDNSVVGYLNAIMVVDECELLKIVVDPLFRKQGFGAMLIDELKQFCLEKKIVAILLEVRVDNVAGIRLYEKENFQAIGKRNGYYNGVDAILYRCILDDQKNKL